MSHSFFPDLNVSSTFKEAAVFWAGKIGDRLQRAVVNDLSTCSWFYAHATKTNVVLCHFEKEDEELKEGVQCVFTNELTIKELFSPHVVGVAHLEDQDIENQTIGESFKKKKGSYASSHKRSVEHQRQVRS